MDIGLGLLELVSYSPLGQTCLFPHLPQEWGQFPIRNGMLGFSSHDKNLVSKGLDTSCVSRYNVYQRWDLGWSGPRFSYKSLYYKQ